MVPVKLSKLLHGFQGKEGQQRNIFQRFGLPGCLASRRATLSLAPHTSSSPDTVSPVISWASL